MAATWITRFINATNTPIRVSNTDASWRPWVNGRQLAVGEEITIGPQRLTDIFIPITGYPGGGITFPAGPMVFDASYWFVGWVDFAQTNIITPKSQLRAVVGPQPNGNDWLRMFDPAENELASVEVGPRGSGWVASVDFHVTFDETAKEVRWNYWNANGIGANILQRIDEQFTKNASDIGKAIFALLF
jgi:hypothetical protein